MRLDARVPDIFLVSSMGLHSQRCMELIRDLQINGVIWAINTGRSVDLLLHQFPMIGMDSREDKFQGRFCRWIAFKDSEGLVGPEVFGGGNVPPKSACVAEPLSLGKICLSTLQFLGQSLMPLSFTLHDRRYEEIGICASQVAHASMPDLR